MKLLVVSLSCLLPALALAAKPALDCSEVTADVPGESEEVVRPKGFSVERLLPRGRAA